MVSECFRCSPIGKWDNYLKFCLSKDSTDTPYVPIDHPGAAPGQTKGHKGTIGCDLQTIPAFNKGGQFELDVRQ